MACPDADTFNQLLADTLDPEARARVVDHAGTCDACRELMSALLGMLSTSGGAPGPVTAAPRQVDRYVIERLLGAGAMGVVYAARDPSLDRAVAIKLLRGAGSAARLTREAQMLAKLHHPNVVAVYDVGEHDGHTFVAMALVDGENLRSWLSKPRDPTEIVRVIRDAGRGLAAAHAAGLIHRDLKPDNIFVAHDGSVQVGDFGLARAETEADAASGGDGPLELTMTGMVLGTPAYMAPEHAAGEPTAASDQFSLCVTAWEALYGERPFAATNYAELQQAVIEGKIRKPPEGRQVPARIRDLLERGLRADPAERFPSVDALVAALAPPRRRWPWVAGATLGAAAIVTTVVFATRPHADPAVACAEHAHDLDDVRPQLAGSNVASAHQALDNYTHDWLALRHDVCMSPRSGSDPRVRCLDRAHGALRELVANLGAIDPDRVYFAATALPHLGDCRSALAETSSVDAVAGEALLAKIETANVRLATMGSDPQPTLDALAAEAAKSGYEPAIVTVAISQGDLYARTGRPDAAEQVLQRALTLAEANHDDRSVARVAAMLAQVSIRSTKLDQARTMIELGSAALARAGDDPETEIEITNARAQAAAAVGDHPAAIDLVKKLIASMSARRGEHSAEVTELWIMLAREYAAAGRLKESADATAKAEVDQIKLSGADQLKLMTKISSAFQRGEVARSVELAHQYVAMARESGRAEMQVDAAKWLAQAYEIGLDWPMMLESNRALVALLDKQAGGGMDELRGSALEGVGLALVELGRSAEAVAPLREAIAVDVKGGGTLDDQRASASIGLAHALLELGKAHDARVILEPIERELIANPGAIPIRKASAELRLAQAMWEDGGTRDRARALALAGDSDRDFDASLERVKDAPESMKASIRRRIEELHAWRKRHQ